MHRSHIILAQTYWKNHLKPKDCIVDATAGNGHDTCFLAQLLDGTGSLVAYDLQAEALLATAQRLSTLSDHLRQIVTLKHTSHAVIEERNLALVVYNLGYLPGGNKNITSMTKTTLASLDSAYKALKPKGALSITCYPGHAEGKREQTAILEWLDQFENVTHHVKNEKAPSVHFLVKSEPHPS